MQDTVNRLFASVPDKLLGLVLAIASVPSGASLIPLIKPYLYFPV